MGISAASSRSTMPRRWWERAPKVCAATTEDRRRYTGVSSGRLSPLPFSARARTAEPNDRGVSLASTMCMGAALEPWCLAHSVRAVWTAFSPQDGL